MNCAESLLPPGNRRPVIAAKPGLSPAGAPHAEAAAWLEACGEGEVGQAGTPATPEPCALGAAPPLETRGSHACRVGGRHYLPPGEERPPDFANQNLQGSQNARATVQMAREQLLKCMLAVGW